MAAPTIEQVMLGIEARLATITGLNTSEIYPGQVTTPSAVVGVPPIPDYHLAMGRGAFELEPTITVLVSTAMDQAGQIALAGYANPTGASSISEAILGDKTLGGVVASCHVRSFRPTELEWGAVTYYGGIFTLYVVAEGGT